MPETLKTRTKIKQIFPSKKLTVALDCRADGPGVYEYNSRTAGMLQEQFGFTGIKVVENFISEKEESILLQNLDQGGVLRSVLNKTGLWIRIRMDPGG